MNALIIAYHYSATSAKWLPCKTFSTMAGFHLPALRKKCWWQWKNRGMTENKPTLYTVLSPALLNLYDIDNAIVVIIDVLRATSTIPTALYNGATCVMPVDSVERCIELGKATNGITAGEREGKVIEGLQHGNSPF